MNIIHITNLSNNKASGISSVVPHHIKWQSRFENVFWYNLNDKYVPSEELKNLYNGLKDYFDLKTGLLPQPFCNPDLVVFHGIYFYKYCKIANVLYKRNIPYIVVPHGSLTESAIKQKALKKKVGIALLFKKFLRNASAIQYLTEGEHEASGDKWNTNYIIIPNGCEMPAFQKRSFCKENLVGSFIGRKSIYYKGLDLLIEAIYLVKDQLITHNFKLLIFGPEEDSSNKTLRELIAKYGIGNLVTIHDPVFGEEKEKILLDSDIFVLTSRTEGHPVALLEALSFGLPSLVTEGTNMDKEIIKYDAGWTARNNPESISQALLTAIKDCSKDNIKSKNAYILASKYEWSNVAKITISKYKKIIDFKEDSLNKMTK